MPSKMYIAPYDTCRAIKHLYIGDANSLARKIKNVYIGVGNIAKRIFTSNTGPKITHIANAATIALQRQYFSTASTGTHAVFAGGSYTNYSNNDTIVKTVDIINDSLVRSNVYLTTARWHTSSTCIGNRVLVCGGATTYDKKTCTNAIDIIDEGLTLSSASTTLATAKRSMGAASNTDYAVIAGGQTYSSYEKGVDAFNSSLTRTSLAELPVTSSLWASASMSKYACVAPTNHYNGMIYVYDQSLVRHDTPVGLSSDRRYACSIGTLNNCLVAAGGYYQSTNFTDAYVYDESLIAHALPDLPEHRRSMTAVTLKDALLFAAGMSSGSTYSKSVFSYDRNFTITQLEDLSLSGSTMYGAAAGEYALFCASVSGKSTGQVDAYKMEV